MCCSCFICKWHHFADSIKEGSLFKDTEEQDAGSPKLYSRPQSVASSKSLSSQFDIPNYEGSNKARKSSLQSEGSRISKRSSRGNADTADKKHKILVESCKTHRKARRGDRRMSDESRRSSVTSHNSNHAKERMRQWERMSEAGDSIVDVAGNKKHGFRGSRCSSVTSNDPEMTKEHKRLSERRSETGENMVGVEDRYIHDVGSLGCTRSRSGSANSYDPKLTKEQRRLSERMSEAENEETDHTGEGYGPKTSRQSSISTEKSSVLNDSMHRNSRRVSKADHAQDSSGSGEEHGSNTSGRDSVSSGKSQMSRGSRRMSNVADGDTRGQKHITKTSRRDSVLSRMLDDSKDDAEERHARMLNSQEETADVSEMDGFAEQESIEKVKSSAESIYSAVSKSRESLKSVTSRVQSVTLRKSSERGSTASINSVQSQKSHERGSLGSIKASFNRRSSQTGSTGPIKVLPDRKSSETGTVGSINALPKTNLSETGNVVSVKGLTKKSSETGSVVSVKGFAKRKSSETGSVVSVKGLVNRKPSEAGNIGPVKAFPNRRCSETGNMGSVEGLPNRKSSEAGSTVSIQASITRKSSAAGSIGPVKALPNRNSPETGSTKSIRASPKRKASASGSMKSIQASMEKNYSKTADEEFTKSSPSRSSTKSCAMPGNTEDMSKQNNTENVNSEDAIPSDESYTGPKSDHLEEGTSVQSSHEKTFSTSDDPPINSETYLIDDGTLQDETEGSFIQLSQNVDNWPQTSKEAGAGNIVPQILSIKEGQLSDNIITKEENDQLLNGSLQTQILETCESRDTVVEDKGINARVKFCTMLDFYPMCLEFRTFHYTYMLSHA